MVQEAFQPVQSPLLFLFVADCLSLGRLDAFSLALAVALTITNFIFTFLVVIVVIVLFFFLFFFALAASWGELLRINGPRHLFRKRFEISTPLTRSISSNNRFRCPPCPPSCPCICISSKRAASSPLQARIFLQLSNTDT